MNPLKWSRRVGPAMLALAVLSGVWSAADRTGTWEVSAAPAVSGPSVPVVSAMATRKGGPNQAAYVTIQSGLTQGCTRLEGVQPPTLDCTIYAGQTFQQNVAATAYADPNGVTPLPVQIDVTPYVQGANFYKVDLLGNELATPCHDTGKVSGRYRYTPGAGATTNPQQPLQLDYFVSTSDGSATAEVRTLLHVLPPSAQARPTILGYTYLDQNANGYMDTGEGGLPGGVINLNGPNGYAAQSHCNTYGRFEFPVPQQQGTYQVVAQPLNGYRPTTPTNVPVDCNQSNNAPIQVNFGYAPANTQLPIQPLLGTDRGCRETGQNPSYTIGDHGSINFGLQGVPEADIALRNILPDGRTVTLVERRRMTGNQNYSIQTTAGDPVGQKQLRLETYYPTNQGGNPDAVANCTYQVTAPYPPDLDLSPGNLDYGSQCQINTYQSRTLTLRNVGQSNLQIYSVGVQGGGGSPYALGSSYQSNPAPIPPGGALPLEVTFRPTGPGSYQDFLIIRTNDPDEAVTTVPLSGQTDGQQQAGLTAQIRTDRGCLERFENPVYFVGEPIQLNFRIDGSNLAQALARIDDVHSDGAIQTIYQNTVPTNRSWALTGARVSPPTGYEMVRLTAQGNQTSATGECTFLVAASGTRIVGYKFSDVNGNGIWEGGPLNPNAPGSEPAIAGWRVNLSGPENRSTQTDAAGRFEFTVTTPGTFLITEETRTGWRPTITQAYQVTLRIFPGEQVGTALFGNRNTDLGGSGIPTPTPIIPTPPGPPTSEIPTPPGPPTPGGPIDPPPPSPTPAVQACQVQISPRPNLMNVGERAAFAAALRSGGPAVGYQWTVDGEVIKDYAEGTTRWWSVTAMQPADYRSRDLSFYWKPLENQRNPQNAGPQPRRVNLTVSTANGGSCTDSILVAVERNNTAITRQADDFYTNNHSQYILREHSWWHATYPFDRAGYDGQLFFDFHRAFVDRFNSWRNEFGYPPVPSWDPATSLPRGVDADHSGRNSRYTAQPKASYFTTLASFFARPWNRMPCDYTFGGQRSLRDFPSDRRLLGCAVTESWHNGVHFAVGGDMLNPQWAPRDPIFWRWHNFVDAVSQERQTMGFAANLQGATGLSLDPPSRSSHAPDQNGGTPPQVIYQVPFRLYRYVADLPSFTVQFNQQVIGVKAGDLTVNGQPATSVKKEQDGEITSYLFTGFPAPAIGAIQIQLAAGAIKNVGDVPYDGEAWTYYRVDPAVDGDRDGLTSREEMEFYLTNPMARDTDKDGLNDGDEVTTYQSDPTQMDSDMDGAGDRCEVEQGTDPNDPAQVARGCAAYFLYLCRLDNGPSIDR